MGRNHATALSALLHNVGSAVKLDGTEVPVVIALHWCVARSAGIRHQGIWIHIRIIALLTADAWYAEL